MSTDAATGASFSHDLADPAYRAAVLDLLGTVAYGELRACIELSADAALAPDLVDRVVMVRLAGVERDHYEALAARIVELGADPVGVMAPFVAAVDGYHERTRGTTWAERLVKAYVGDGIRTDFYRAIAGLVDADTAALVTEVSSSAEGRDDALVRGIRGAIEADPAVEGRLALWGRRLMGEALSQAQGVAVEREGLAALLLGGVGTHGGDIAALGRMVAQMTAAHGERMAALGLSA